MQTYRPNVRSFHRALNDRRSSAATATCVIGEARDQHLHTFPTTSGRWTFKKKKIGGPLEKYVLILIIRYNIVM